MRRPSLMIDLDACIGCKSCEAACKAEHGLGPGEYRNKVLWLEEPDVPNITFLTATCQHCDRPACLRACPVEPKAIRKDPDTGVVSVDEDLCTGCGECVSACPYGAMGFDQLGHHAVKCNLCSERRDKGEQPACAAVCPTRAISFGDHSKLKTEALSQGRDLLDHDHFLLGPTTLYIQPRGQFDAPSLDKTTSAHTPQIMTESRPAISRKSPTVKAPYLTPRHDRAANRTVAGGCNICFNACPVKYHFREDELVAIAGNDEDPIFEGRVCPKSQMMLQMYASDKRLTKPLKRAGAKGEDRFEEIEWDQALDEISKRLEKIKEMHGPEALAIYLGTRAGVIHRYGYANRFAKMWGTPNVEGSDSFCSAGKNLAYTLVQGSRTLGNIYTPEDIGSAELYVYLGDNQAETRPVYFGMVNEWRHKNGAAMICVDPRLTPTASKSDKWLAIRPGTDMALGLALIHTIFLEALHDQDFCNQWLEGWEAWRTFVEERDYSAEWAEPITDIPAAEIRDLARRIAGANGCMIFGSRGLNQHTNSTQTNRVLMFVAACTGNWGRLGGGYFNMTSAQHPSSAVPANRMAKITRPAVGKGPMMWLDSILEEKPYKLHAMICGSNPMAQWPAQSRSRAAMRELDLVVQIELVKNQTSLFADYVLPAATGIERGGITRSADDRRIIWNDPLIEAPGEAKPDGWIWIELGKRFGYGDVLKEEYKDIARFWDEQCINTDDLRGCTTERLRLKPNRSLRLPLASTDAPEPGSLLLSESNCREQSLIHTASGKLEFWTQEQEDRFNALGMSALPEFYSDREQLVDLPSISRSGDFSARAPSPFYANTMVPAASLRSQGDNPEGQELRRKGYDTELITGRPPAPHFHSWTHYFWQSQEMWPDLYVQIHPEKAEKLQIKDGDRMRVETDSGNIVARAWVRAGIRKNAVFVPIGWSEADPYTDWKTVNHLTNSDQRDPLSEQVNLKSQLCKVSRIPAT